MIRPSLAALATALGLVLLASLAAALDLPAARPARVAEVVLAWASLAALLAYFFLPAFDLPWRVHTRAPGATDGAPTVALTFDDGPHPETTPAILAALAAAGVRATFFLVGAAVERWPELARAIAGAGHAIGNHTHRHRLLVFRTDAQLADEIARCQAALATLGRPARLFRPPHGFKPLGLHRQLRRQGLQLVAWRGSIRDTDAPGPVEIARRALALARPGAILLLHDNPTCQGQTAAALPSLIAGYRALGYLFVALD